MKKIILRPTVALLTFIVGVALTASFPAIIPYRRCVMKAREATLRDNLFLMRKMIDQYAADRGTLPKSLYDLERAGYLWEIPVDPITGQEDWIVIFGDDPNAL